MWVVVSDPAAPEVKASRGAIPAPTTDLDKEGTTVGMSVVTLVLMDSTLVVDAGTFMVKTPSPKVTAAGCASHVSVSYKAMQMELTPAITPSKVKLRVTPTEDV